MLKALELYGFKSFADKTRFEFPPGITVIVGPNGSGKSNVVDAIKWVLGEQSAKSLRGQDMADVIFKGAGGGRKPMNAAEATLVFDNADRRLAIDAPEVHVTRRLYRSGESEYLINRQPCRLRDLRDILRGTGVGVDAYSLIEQGKVDRLLSASARDRRAIFEEAAGISRFKAKRIECQRRLARVDQNLLRLSDIVEEVEDRLKSVRAQASKARRYRQCAQRLQQLRTHVGRVDWRLLSARIDAQRQAIAELRKEVEAAASEQSRHEAEAKNVDQALTAAAEAEQQAQARLAQIRERLAALEAAGEHEQARHEELRQQIAALSHQAASARGRLAALEKQARSSDQSLAEAEAERQAVAADWRKQRKALEEASALCDRLRSENAARRQQHVEWMKAASLLGNQASAGQSQLESLTQAAEQAHKQRQALETEAGAHTSEVDRLVAEEHELSALAADQMRQAEQAQHDLASARRLLARRQDEFSQLRLRRSAASERAALLEELERKLEGLGAGVKEVVARARQESPGAFGDVRGLVADLFQVAVEMAPLVDAALGETAQHAVLSGDRLLNDLASGAWRPPGRVGFVLLEPASDKRHAGESDELPPADLAGEAGVIDRGDRVVQCDEQFRGLAERLLSCVWLVETLDDALRLSRRHRACKFVTRAGEVVEPDGLVLIGARQSAAGLISRRSELRALVREIGEIDRQLAGAEREIGSFHQQIKLQEGRVQSLARAQHAASEKLAVHRLLVQTALSTQQQLSRRCASAAAEAASAETARAAAESELERIRLELAETEQAIAQKEGEIAQSDRLSAVEEARRDELSRQATAAEVRLAKSEERCTSLGAQARAAWSELSERQRSLAELETQLEQLLTRRQQTELAVLFASSAGAELALAKEDWQRRLAAERQERLLHQDQRAQIAEQMEGIRKRLREAADSLHKHELAEGDLLHQRSALAERLREDYGIEPAELEQPADPLAATPAGEAADEPAVESSGEEAVPSEGGQEEGGQAKSHDRAEDRAEIDREILELRRKIQQIGAVNLDALDELDDLESRFNALSKQYQDLTQAKQSLERIIDRINADSRRLFVETLDAIRANFQTLYRKAFGGGNADLVLETGEDVLEGGVEIVATPPGKPSFNNSLLSGGEKALTAVALLLAIFQFRPSPFCVLDEVDAPFDEANIGRFVEVLGDFLSWTRFVIVTHSKKTMTSAHTLYGVTMEESGVSKRVSVRFEDVSEDGQISPAAVARGGDERGAA